MDGSEMWGGVANQCVCGCAAHGVVGAGLPNQLMQAPKSMAGAIHFPHSDPGPSVCHFPIRSDVKLGVTMTMNQHLG
jgi:hypothetical protein